MIKHHDAGKDGQHHPQRAHQRRRQKWLWKLMFCSIGFAFVSITNQHHMIEVYNSNNEKDHGLILDEAINIPYSKQQQQQKHNMQSTTTTSGTRKLSTTLSKQRQRPQQTTSLPSCKENGCVILYIHIPKTGECGIAFFAPIIVPS